MSDSPIVYASLHKPQALFRATGDGFEPVSAPLATPVSAYLILDGRDVFRRAIDLPIADLNKARAAAKFALEDEIAQDIDSCHIALAATGSGQGHHQDNHQGHYSAEAVDEEKFEQLLTACKNLNITPVGAYSLTSLFTGDQAITLTLPDEDQLVLVEDAGNIIALDADLYDAETAAISLQDYVANWQNSDTKTAPLDLLQGKFRPRMPLKDIWLIWRRPALALLMISIAFMSLILGETASLKAQTKALDDRTNRLMSEVFPGVRNIPHMRQRLRSLAEGSGDPFLSNTSILLEAMTDVDGSSLISLRYDKTRNLLTATIEFQGFDDVRRLEAEVRRRGGQMSEGASRQVGGLVISDISLDRSL